MPEDPRPLAEDGDEIINVHVDPIARLELKLQAEHAAHDRRVQAIEALQAGYVGYDRRVRQLVAEIDRLRAGAAAQAASESATG